MSKNKMRHLYHAKAQFLQNSFKSLEKDNNGNNVKGVSSKPKVITLLPRFFVY